MQDELTREIISALKVKLTPEKKDRLVRKGTIDEEAYDLFLRGRELLFGKKLNRKIFDQIVALFSRAIELDPNYAEPYGGLAMAHNFNSQNHWTSAPDALDVAEHFATLAIEKGPEVPFVHWLAAVVALWKRNLEGAKRETETALALNPNYALAYGTRGHVEVYAGNPMEAIPFIEQAIRLDPAFTQQYTHFLGSAYLVAGKYEAAAASFRERIRLSLETDLSRGLLASALGHLGEIDEARRIWTELKQVNPKYSFTQHLARLPFSNPADATGSKTALPRLGYPTEREPVGEFALKGIRRPLAAYNVLAAVSAQAFDTLDRQRRCRSTGGLSQNDLVENVRRESANRRTTNIGDRFN